MSWHNILDHDADGADYSNSALVTPPYFLAGVISIFWAASSGRFNERTWHLTIAKGIAVVGFIVGTVTLNTGARYFSMSKWFLSQSLPPYTY